ncbi:hypothetical protein OPW32_10805 [Vibrio europaeus]|uniref:hypothetical protein n=1 Tax=Vibrio europaeus TaxID=300876 RepID=UPI002340F416|nr:hypothetical protein [Vibrio europaeus]MDC5849683.1 hypothetical protein [Vibrio europaeus]
MSIKNLKLELKKLEEQGETFVSIDALLEYLEKVEVEDVKRHELTVADFNAKNQSAVEKYKEDRAEWRELFKAVISNGQATIRLLATINGGAALALLAFIGKVWGEELPNSFMGQNITLSLFFLCVGVGISALTQGFAYVGQHFFTYDNDKLGAIFQKLTALLGIGSLTSFFVGIGYACKGFGLLL